MSKSKQISRQRETKAQTRLRYWGLLTCFVTVIIAAFLFTFLAIIRLWPALPRLIPQVEIPYVLKALLTAFYLSYTASQMYVYLLRKLTTRLHNFWFERNILTPEEYQTLVGHLEIPAWSIALTTPFSILFALI